MVIILKKAIPFLIFILLFGVSPAIAGEVPVSGTFKGNGKNAKLNFATSFKGDTFGGQETTMVVLTEKDPGAEKRPDNKAAFGKLGNALIITIDQEGDIIGCEVYHQAHSKKPFSSIGKLKLEGWVRESDFVKGKLSTGGHFANWLRFNSFIGTE